MQPAVVIRTIEEIIQKNAVKTRIDRSKLDIKHLVINQIPESDSKDNRASCSLPSSNKNSVVKPGQRTTQRYSFARLANAGNDNSKNLIKDSELVELCVKGVKEMSQSSNNNPHTLIKIRKLTPDAQNITQTKAVAPYQIQQTQKKVKRKRTETQESIILIGNSAKTATQPSEPTSQENLSPQKTTVEQPSKLNKALNTFLLKLNILQHPFGKLTSSKAKKYKMTSQPEPVVPAVYSVLPPRPRRVESSKNSFDNSSHNPDNLDRRVERSKRSSQSLKKEDKIPEFIMLNLQSIPQLNHKTSSRTNTNSLAGVDKKASSQIKFWRKEQQTKLLNAKPGSASARQGEENNILSGNTAEYVSMQPQASQVKLLAKEDTKTQMQKTATSFRGKKMRSLGTVRQIHKGTVDRKINNQDICAWDSYQHDNHRFQDQL